MRGETILPKERHLLAIPLIALVGVVLLCWLFSQAMPTIAIDINLVESPMATSIETSLRVGLDSSQCSEEKKLIVEPGTTVVYCYYVKNSGTENLIGHTVYDDQFGRVLENTPFVLAPEEPIFFTITRPIEQTTTNLAIWTSYLEGSELPSGALPSAPNATNSVQDEDTVTVYVPTFDFNVTVGTNADECGTQTSIDVLPGTPVYYCYKAINTSQIPIMLHRLSTNARTILEDPSQSLTPGEQFTYGPANIYIAKDSLTESLTWVAEALDTTGNRTAIEGVANTTVRINVAGIETGKHVGLSNDECQPGPLTLTITLTVQPIEPVQVVYCYFVNNTGQVTLRDHRVEDSEEGALIERQNQVIEPGGGVGFNITKTILDSNTPLTANNILTSTVSWYVSITDTFVLSATDNVTINLNIVSEVENLYLPVVHR